MHYVVRTHDMGLAVAAVVALAPSLMLRLSLPAWAQRPIIKVFHARWSSMIVLRPPLVDVPGVTMWLKPNRVLSQRGMGRLIGSLAAWVLTTAALGAWQGNVFAPLYALVESSAIALALGAAWRAGDRGERITVDEQSLEVCELPSRHCVRFPSYWVRVLLKPGGGHQRLMLASHGREMEIGAFLADEERAELSRKLMVLLDECRNPQRR